MQKGRLFDLGAAAPLIVFYCFAVAGLGIQTAAGLRAQEFSAQLALWLVQQAVFAIFFGLQVVLFAIRRLPVEKARGWLPRLAAAIGAYGTMSLLAMPRVSLHGGWSVASTTLGVLGTAAAIVVLVRLGRAFSVFPQARGLVTDGPYRFVRHPLYVCELVASLGIMMQFRQPWAAGIVAASFAVQFVRMRHEETILERAFPEYATYKQQTAMLIPGLL